MSARQLSRRSSSLKSSLKKKRVSHTEEGPDLALGPASEQETVLRARALVGVAGRIQQLG